jgi:hypothetical protein
MGGSDCLDAVSAHGGPASVSGATALASTLICLWLMFVDMERASLWKIGVCCFQKLLSRPQKHSLLKFTSLVYLY